MSRALHRRMRSETYHVISSAVCSDHSRREIRMSRIPHQNLIGALMAVLVSMETTSAVVAWPCPFPCDCDSRQQTVSCDEPMGYSVPEGLPSDVRSLSMSNQNITVLHALSRATLVNLRKLEMVRSNIKKLQDNALAMAPRLRRLNMTGNYLARVPRAVSSLAAIRELILSNNYITHLAPEDFKNLTKLRILDLSINMISMLPGGMFDSLQELRSLNLSYNVIYSISERTFASLEHLEDLYLSINRIEILAPGWMDNLRGLWTLEISAAVVNHTQSAHILPEGRNITYHNLLNLKIAGNGIRELPCSALRFMPNVAFIDMSHNSIATIPHYCFAGMSSIREFVISHNIISSIEWGAFYNASGVNTLDVRNNRLEFLYPFTFYSLYLQQLILDNNKIRAITNETLLGALYLINLTLRGNGMYEISPQAFASNYYLQTIDFRENNMKSIGSQFVNLSSVTALAFSNNQISRIQTNAFEGTQVVFLFLDNNSMSTLPESVLSYMPQLYEIRLENNPWHCDCRIRYLCEKITSEEDYPWLKSAPLMRCSSPRIFHDKEMKAIQSFQMICTTYASALAIQLIVGLSLSAVAVSTALYVVQIYCKAKKMERNGGEGGKCLP